MSKSKETTIHAKHPLLLNVTYVRPSKANDNQEYFEVIYKDDNGDVRRTEEPGEGDIYIVKPEHRSVTYTKPQERLDHMDKLRVPISRIRSAIAEAQGEAGKQFVKTCFQNNNFRALNQLYKWPYAYGCDFQPEYYYMKNWYERYPIDLTSIKLTKSFLDIEVDQIDGSVDLDNLADTAIAPVNVVTVFIDETRECFTFVLEPQMPSRLGRTQEEFEKRYKLYEHQMAEHQDMVAHMDDFIARIRREFCPMYGDDIKFAIRTYHEEIDLIADIFRLINSRKPNFCETWNMRFDIQYLYYRIIKLGYDPASIMCHKDFKTKSCFFKVDRTTHLLEKQYDYFYCSSYTQFICQMRLFASIRKSQHKLKSVKLNAIADLILKDKKVEYPENTNIRLFPYRDWPLFILYNIKDVLLQVGIERNTNDIMTYYLRSHKNLTPYNKIFKETHLLRNVRELYFEREGWVQSNNLNIIDSDEDESAKRFYGGNDDEDEGETSFKGAIMADPRCNDYIGKRILGRKTNNVFPNCMDFDMGAFYPSIKIACNMDPGTLLFKAAFDNYEFQSAQCINRSLNTVYEEKDKFGNLRKIDITGEAVNTYVSGCVLTFVYNYLGIPDINSLAVEVIKELKQENKLYA